MAMSVAMPVTVHVSHLFVRQDGLRVAFHQLAALADDSVRTRVLGNVANLFQGFMQGIMTFAMIFTVVCAMTVTMRMTVAMYIAMSGRFCSKSRRCHQSRCEYRRCDLIEFHFILPLTFKINLHPHTVKKPCVNLKENKEVSIHNQTTGMDKKQDNSILHRNLLQRIKD